MLNKVILIGRLTRDPQATTLDSGNTYCKFTIAVDRYSRDNDNKADFINITAWNALAQNCAKYLTKGKQVAVVGSIQTGSYEKNGVKYSTFEVRADQVEFLSGKDETAQKPNVDVKMDDLRPVDDDDDMPF